MEIKAIEERAHQEEIVQMVLAANQTNYIFFPITNAQHDGAVLPAHIRSTGSCNLICSSVASQDWGPDVRSETLL